MFHKYVAEEWDYVQFCCCASAFVHLGVSGFISELYCP